MLAFCTTGSVMGRIRHATVRPAEGHQLPSTLTISVSVKPCSIHTNPLQHHSGFSGCYFPPYRSMDRSLIGGAGRALWQRADLSYTQGFGFYFSLAL